MASFSVFLFFPLSLFFYFTASPHTKKEKQKKKPFYSATVISQYLLKDLEQLAKRLVRTSKNFHTHFCRTFTKNFFD